MNFFEDMKVGDRNVLGSFTFTAEAIKRFAEQFDPQPFHLSEEAGRNSLFGGLAASGWHTTAIFMKLTVADDQRRTAAFIAQGGVPVASGPSPGFKNLKWHRPVMAGDTLTYVAEVTSLRTLASRPQWGIMLSAISATNQHRNLGLSFEGSVFLPRRPEA